MFEYTYNQDNNVTSHDSVERKTTLTMPEHLVSLASSAVLVTVNVSVWSATKQDRGISDEITMSKHADKDAGKFTKNLLANHAKHKAVLNYRQTVYNWMTRRTYDWNGAQRCLPSVDLPKFMVEYRQHETEFHRLIDEFINHYDSIVSDMAFKQGSMFNRNDYPSKDEIRSKFKINLFTAEVPMNDFRCGIAQDIAEDLFSTLSKQTEEIVQSILREQSERFIDVMQSISHSCGQEDIVADNGEIKTKKRKVYQSTIEKAKEMCETFKQFNLVDSQELEQARAMLEKALNGVSADDIRDSDAVRSAVKNDVDEILNKFGAFSFA